MELLNFVFAPITYFGQFYSDYYSVEYANIIDNVGFLMFIGTIILVMTVGNWIANHITGHLIFNSIGVCLLVLGLYTMGGAGWYGVKYQKCFPTEVKFAMTFGTQEINVDKIEEEFCAQQIGENEFSTFEARISHTLTVDSLDPDK